MNKLYITVLMALFPLIGYAEMTVSLVGDVSRNGFTVSLQGDKIVDSNTISFQFGGVSRTLPIPPELTKERQESIYAATNKGIAYLATMTFAVFQNEREVDIELQEEMETGGTKNLQIQFGSDSGAINIAVPEPETLDKNEGIHISECPYIPTIRAFKDTEVYEVCTHKDALQKLITRDIESEINRYQVQLDRLYTESITVPEQLAKHAVFELRRHGDCLDQICNVSFNECINQNIGGSTGVNMYADQLQWCYEAADTMLTMAEAKTKNTYYRRQYRMTEAIQEKNAAIYKRFDMYIFPQIQNVIRYSTQFLRNLTGTIETPT